MTNPTSRLKQFERDFFVSRVSCGYIPVLKDYRVYPATDEILYESCEAYSSAYSEAERLGIYTDDDMPDVLTILGLWSSEMAEELEKIVVEDIDNFKVACFENIGNADGLKEARRCLKIAKQHQRNLFSIRHQFDYATCEGLAMVAKWQYIVLNSLRDKKKKLITIEDNGALIANILAEYQSKTVGDSIIREISHHEPWSSIWSTSCKNIKIFRVRSTEDQKRLISWSRFYENITKSHDCPHESVIEDDDILDGWVIKQRRDREKDKAKSEDEEFLSSKAGSCDEVFVPISAIEKNHKQKTGEILTADQIITRINNLNNNLGRSTKASRQALINQKGQVNHAEFADAQIQMLNQLSGKE